MKPIDQLTSGAPAAVLPQPAGVNAGEAAGGQRGWLTLVGLMLPMGMMVLTMSMFSVAMPSLRNNFVLDADQAAWVVTAYSLPFVLFMPLYGRLGDALGKRQLFLWGIVIFMAGIGLAALARDLPMLIVARVIQGIGSSGLNPLAIALIIELFPRHERGRALGTWSSVGPGISTFAPFLGGYLVDHWGWRVVFPPVILVGLFALYGVSRWLPKLRSAAQPRALRSFDWLGMLLFGGTTVCLIFYLSSRPITGVEPLRDWRLLAGMLLFLAAFYGWERRQRAPLVDFGLFGRRNFGRASLCALIRMYLMSSESFLIPLYFTDIFDLSAAQIGVIMSLYAGALLSTTRLAGQLADRGNGRQLIVGAFTLQSSMMALCVFLPGTSSALWPALAWILHGLGAGMSLAVLSHVAMTDVDPSQSGVAAGAYSTVRFMGNTLGATIGGAILHQALATTTPLQAYQIVFASVAVVGFSGMLLAWRLR